MGPHGPYKKKRWYVDKKTGCWLWLLSTCDGYGQTWDGTIKKVRLAHVVNYEKKYGPVPKGKELDHFVCDTRRCCNPDHVKPVSHLANVRRGRKTKLNWRLVKKIRKEAVAGKSHSCLAKKYGVRRKRIWSVVNLRCWVARGQKGLTY